MQSFRWRWTCSVEQETFDAGCLDKASGGQWWLEVSYEMSLVEKKITFSSIKIYTLPQLEGKYRSLFIHSFLKEILSVYYVSDEC